MPDPTPQFNDILLYSAPTGKVKIEVFFEGETFWLSQRKMAELFGVDVRTVNEHLQNIYKTNELLREATIRDFRIVQSEGDLNLLVSAYLDLAEFQARLIKLYTHLDIRHSLLDIGYSLPSPPIYATRKNPPRSSALCPHH